MSSKFNPGKTRSKVPGYCVKEVGPLGPTYIWQRPVSLSGLGSWVEPGLGWQAADSLRLIWDPAIPGWSGHSPGPGYTVAIAVEILAIADLYDLEISIYHDNAHLEDFVFSDVHIPPGPPFNSGLQYIHYPSSHEIIQIRVLD